MRVINTNGLKIIKDAEGLRLKAYVCPAGVLTIGYGSTGKHVTPGMVITEFEAEQLLMKDLDRFEQGVASLCPVATSNQFSALVSFAFNVGVQALRNSTLRRLHNEGKYGEAAEQFGRWNKARGKVLPGLTKRRAAERALYLK